MICLEPVAYFHCEATEKADVPRQASLAQSNRGQIRFLVGKNFEQALQDLEGTSHIWILFWMDRVGHWKAKVKPPRATCKKGVFATRSPHRPNPIGLSCVQLVSVSGLVVTVQGHDLLDGTPILDIKPYLAYADSIPKAEVGWMRDLDPLQENQVIWSTLALKQVLYIDQSCALQKAVEQRLKFFVLPTASNRIICLEGPFYLQAYKAWRFVLKRCNEKKIQVLAVFSGSIRQTIEEAFYQEFLKPLSSFLKKGSLLPKLKGKVYWEF